MGDILGTIFIFAVIIGMALFVRHRINKVVDTEPEISVMVEQTEPVSLSLTEHAVYEYHQLMREKGEEVI